MYLVYCHTNLINGKQYVGITSSSIEYRAGKDGIRYKNCPVFYNAIQKYGWDNFDHRVLAYDLTHQRACELEKYYIAQYNTQIPNGYNLTDGGDGGFHHTDVTKRKLSCLAKGNKSRTGMHNSAEMNLRMSELMRGNKYGSTRTISAEYREKARLAQPQRVPIIQLDMSGNIVGEYASLKEAEHQTGIAGTNIGKVVAGKSGYNTAGGYYWKRKGQ